MPRRVGYRAAAAVLLACLLGATDAAGCPTLATKASIRKSVAGGKPATLSSKMVNNGAQAISDAGLALTLPTGFSYTNVRATPKPALAPAFEQQGNMVAWTGITIASGKARAFRIKLGVDKSAGDTAVPPKHGSGKPSNLFGATIGVATFTGPVDNQLCLVPQSVKVRCMPSTGKMAMRDRASAYDASLHYAHDCCSVPFPPDDGAPPQGGHEFPHAGAHTGAHAGTYSPSPGEYYEPKDTTAARAVCVAGILKQHSRPP